MPTTPEGEKALRKSIWEVDGGPITRRTALALTLSVPLGIEEIVSGWISENNYERKIAEFNAQFPELPEEVTLNAAQYELYLQLQDQGYVTVEGIDTDQTIKEIFQTDSPEFKLLQTDYQEVQNWRERRDKAARDKYGLPIGMFRATFGISLIMGLTGAGAINTLVHPGGPSIFEARQERWQDLYDLVEKLKPEWIQQLPSKRELKEFFETAKLLPPVGGKVVPSSANQGFIILRPHYVGEQLATETTEKMQKGEYGEAIVHQLTVQGRLPDKFKYAAAALILNSPFQNDWTQPFFSAPWGSVAPLIHDGGNTETKYNKRWKKIKGRTDFLQRVFVNFDESDPNSEGMIANLLESERMILEARFYQRAALALHSHVGTTPRAISSQMRESLADEWLLFENKMRGLLSYYQLEDVVDVQWFLDKSREVPNWSGERFEADYDPVKTALISVEEAKKRDPITTREATAKIMVQTIDAVDNIIGLNKFIA